MIRDHLQAILDSGGDKEELNDQIRQAAALYGSAVYPELIRLLTSLELDRVEALVFWRRVFENWQYLEEELGRPVALMTAVCDQVSSVPGLIQTPRLVDGTRYDRSVRDAHFDKLTGLYERHYIDELLDREVAATRRHGSELSLLLFSIDNLDELCGLHGKEIASAILQRVAEIVRKTKRVEDIACRHDGDRVLLILPRTGGHDASNLGRRIQRQADQTPIEKRGRPIHFSLSAGLATAPRYGTTLSALLQSCEAALFRTKTAGRGTITLPSVDKRRNQRVGVSMPIMVKSFGFNGSRVISAHGQDISLSGFRFFTDAELAKGSRIEVLIPLSEERSVTLVGEVVRVDEAPQGLEVAAELCFQRMAKQSQQAISAFMAERGSVSWYDALN